MQTQASRMARLIDDLLSLSRIEMRAEIASGYVEPISLAFVRQVLDGLQTLARERDVNLSLAVPAKPLMVQGDRDELIALCSKTLSRTH